MTKLSVIIPVYHNELNLKPLYQDLKEKFIDKINFDYEIVMVDDGSTDDSWSVIKELAKTDKNIKAIHLSKNFGSHSAILCGLANCSGDCALVKAADLQEPTELILDMYNKWLEGFKVVLAQRKTREDSSFFADLYYRIVNHFIFKQMPERGFDVYLIDRKVINVLTALDESDSTLTLQILWSGFKTSHVLYERKAREIGKSQWTLKKKIKMVMDSIYSFSSLPIAFISVAGALSVVISCLWSVILIACKLFGNISVSGYTSIILFILFAFGTIMLTLGILGGYIWRILNATRNRPLYIIEEKIDNENR